MLSYLWAIFIATVHELVEQASHSGLVSVGDSMFQASGSASDALAMSRMGIVPKWDWSF